jgi:hypothetical protein
VQTSVLEKAWGLTEQWVRPTHMPSYLGLQCVAFHLSTQHALLPHTYFCTSFYSNTRDTSGDKILPVSILKSSNLY